MPDEIEVKETQEQVAGQPSSGEANPPTSPTPAPESPDDEDTGLEANFESGDFDGFLYEDGEAPAAKAEPETKKEEAVKPEEPKAPVAPVAPAPVAVQPTPVQQPAPVAPVAPEAQPAPVPTPAQPQVPETQGQPQAGQESGLQGLARQLQEGRPQLLKAIAQERFALSQEELDALETDPGSAIPQLGARIYLDVLTSVVNLVGNNLPQMIDYQTGLREQSRQREEQFYGMYPDLKDVPKEKLAPLVNAWKQAMPQASLQEIMTAVGLQARTMYKPQGAPPVAQPVAPVQPQAQPAKPFTPASAGAGGGITRVTSNDENPWSTMNGLWDST